MTTSATLPCPRCKLALETYSWHDATSGSCRRCGTDFEFVPFPALTAAPAKIAPQAAVLAAESVCFFHAENRAEAVCDECGRFLCSVCAIPTMGRKLCPTCMAALAKPTAKAETAVRDRILWDSISFSMALVPVILIFLPIVTAPMAIGCAIYGWNKPGSLVRGRRRWVMVLAIIVALAEIAWWVFFFGRLATEMRHLPAPRR